MKSSLGLFDDANSFANSDMSQALSRHERLYNQQKDIENRLEVKKYEVEEEFTQKHSFRPQFYKSKVQAQSHVQLQIQQKKEAEKQKQKQIDKRMEEI